MNDPGDDPTFARASELLSTDLAAAMTAAESAVVRWAWYTADGRFSPEPFYAQRRELPRGRALPDEPDLTSGDGVRCGFDQHDRAVVTSEYDVGPWNVRHTVRSFDGDTCREVVFAVKLRAAGEAGGGELQWVTLYEYEQGLVTRQATVRPPASPITEPDLVVRERHLWEYSYGPQGRLDRVHGRSWSNGYDAETARRVAAGAIEAFEYDDKGRLERITVSGVLPGAPPWIRYRRRTKASTSRTALAAQLAQSIENAVKGCAFGEQVWCLALHYERESPLAPDVVLGAERERREWGNDVDLLNPAEWDADDAPRRLRLVDADVLDACAAAMGGPSGADAAVKLLNATAKRLNRAGLGDHLDVTEDFFVYAVDLELEQLDANLRAALGAQRYRRLSAAGLTAP